MIKSLIQWLFPEPPPVLKEMPPHVRDLHIDPWLLMRAMENAQSENPAVDLGYKVPRV